MVCLQGWNGFCGKGSVTSAPLGECVCVWESAWLCHAFSLVCGRSCLPADHTFQATCFSLSASVFKLGGL